MICRDWGCACACHASAMPYAEHLPAESHQQPSCSVRNATIAYQASMFAHLNLRLWCSLLSCVSLYDRSAAAHMFVKRRLACTMTDDRRALLAQKGACKPVTN